MIGRCRWLLTATIAVYLIAVGPSAQTPSFRLAKAGGVIKARVERLGFIAGPVLGRLKDGRAMRVDLEFSIAAAETAPPVAVAQGTFQVSYDLWEERYATMLAGDVPRTASHLTPAGSEAWCLDQLTIRADGLPAAGRGTLFAQVTYVVRDEEEIEPRQDALSLRGLIDRLSRRNSRNEWRGTVRSGAVHLE